MKNSINKDATLLTITKIINLLISMINAMILSRYRTLEEYGTYSQLNMVITLLITIMIMGLPGSINYFIAKAESNKEKTKFISNYYTLSTILSILTGIILLFLMPLIVRYFKNELIISFSFYLLLMPWINIIGSSISNLFIVYKKVKILSIYNICTSVILLGILLISVVLNLSFMQYMYVYVVIQIIITLFVYLVAKKLAGDLYIEVNKVLLKNILKFSIPLGLASIVSTVSIELDKLLISYFFDTEALAIYTNAAREMPVTIISTSLTAVLMPHLVHLLNVDENNKAISLWRASTSLSYTLICFFSSTLFVFAPEVITLLYSEKYLPGVSVFRIYSLVILLRCTYFGIVLNSIGKTKLVLYSSIASLVLNVILNYYFYKIFGFIGPAIATFVAILLVGIFQLFATSKSVKIPFSKIFPWKNVLIITLINVIMGVGFYIIKINIPGEQLIGGIMESVVLGVLWGVLYGIIMFKFVRPIWTSINSY